MSNLCNGLVRIYLCRLSFFLFVLRKKRLLDVRFVLEYTFFIR